MKSAQVMSEMGEFALPPEQEEPVVEGLGESEKTHVVVATPGLLLQHAASRGDEATGEHLP